MKSLIVFGQNTNPGTSAAWNEPATNYQSPVAAIYRQGSEAQCQLKVVAAGTVRNFRTYVPSNGVGASTVITVRKNSADTSITVSYTASQTGEKEDTTNTSSLSALDNLAYKIVTPATSGTQYCYCTTGSIEFEPTTSGDTYTFVGVGTGAGNFSNASATRYPAWNDGFAATATSDLYYFPVYGGGSIEYWQSYAGAVRATATTWQLVINGSGSTTHQNTHTATGWYYDNSTSTLSDLDTLSNSITNGTGTDTFTGLGAFVQIKNTAGKWTTTLGDNSVVALAAATTYYEPIGGDLGAVANTTEANVQHRFRFDVKAEYLWTSVTANAISAGQTTTVTLRKGGADQTDLQVSYTNGQTGTKSDTGSVSFTTADLANLKVVVGSGGTTTFRTFAIGWNSGPFANTGTLAATEAQDTAALVGTRKQNITGTLAATEAQDTSSISGTLKHNLTGTLAATEAQDVAAIAGAVFEVITGTLAATEAQDTAAISGTVGSGPATITGTLAATEASDTASIQGLVFEVITGTLAATEAQDTCSIATLLIHNLIGVLNATEASDIAAIVGTTSGVPSVVWSYSVGHSGVSGAGVIEHAYTDAGTEISSVSADKTDSITRRWRV